MQIVKNGDTTLESQNEFTKKFKYNEIELYVSKAFDEESDAHFLVNSIPKIEDLGVANIQLPIAFESEEERNRVFDGLDVNEAKSFLDALIEQIKQQKENLEK
jgi:hypothetical protein